MMLREAIQKLQEGLDACKDAENARAMAAYMKTEMPFYGVKKPERVPLLRALHDDLGVESQADYERAVLALWKLPHREEKYAALFIAQRCKRFVALASLPLYERMIREGQWWDLVDEVAAHLVSPLQLAHRAELEPIMDRWINDPDMWIRRAAILSQLKHKKKTDPEQLFRYSLARADEKEFFIRKAIGWALRDYAWHEPEKVRAFLKRHGEKLSGLSRREASKNLP